MTTDQLLKNYAARQQAKADREAAVDAAGELAIAVGSAAYSLFQVFSMLCNLALSPILKAYVIWFGWRWFAIPLGLPPLTPAHLVGLAVLVGYAITQHGGYHEDKRPIQYMRVLLYTFVRPALFLLVLYVVKCVAFGI